MTQWIAACAADDIDPEDVIPFTRGGQDYAIYRSPDDVYYATDGHCTHEKTLLCDGLVMDGVIECPKHNGALRLHQRQGARRPGADRHPHPPGQGHGRYRLYQPRGLTAPVTVELLADA
jgi:MocE subfamily Rieske [2Fe-2S] domain protein